jgi:hypothetical protein
MRLALEQGILPRRYALGAAAALAHLDPVNLDDKTLARTTLDGLWREAVPDPAEKDRLMVLIEAALEKLRAWRTAGFPDLDVYYNSDLS